MSAKFGLQVLLSAAILISLVAVVASAGYNVIATAVIASSTTTTTSSTSTSSSTTKTTTATTTTTIPYCTVNHWPWGWFSDHFGRFLPPSHQNNCISTTTTSTSTISSTTTIRSVDTGLGNPTVSPTSPASGSGFTIACPAKNQNFNCINAYANGLQKECTWIKWVGNNAIFDCHGMPAGTYTAECEAIPDTNNHCAEASTTLSYSVIAPTTTTTTTKSTTIPTTKSTTVHTTTINPCHYWDGQDYDGCSPLTTTESTTIPTTSTKSTTILPTTTVTTCTTCPTGTKASGDYCVPQCKRGVPCPQYILLCPSAS